MLPWTIGPRARKLVFCAMTVTDTGSNLVEIKHMLSTTAKAGAHAVENTWLSRCPKPIRIASDQGPEHGQKFTTMCENNGIRHSTSTSRNPQGDLLIERIHETIGQMLCAIV